MTQLTEQLILAALRNVREPELHKGLVTLNLIRRVDHARLPAHRAMRN